MTPERWKQIDDIFQNAMDRPTGERQSFVNQACADDAELRAEVLDLLKAVTLNVLEPAVHAAMADFSASIPRPPEVNDHVGPYRLVECIGRGGMGMVCRARRESGDFEQEVAIKFLRAEVAHGAVAERFLSERRILATLQHPFIARLIDGGSHHGLPYFVMEFAAGGRPIDAYCDEQGLSTRKRLELFLKVCDAIEHAHQRLIVHRDLKPSNVLVLPDGTPKLLDFGIAKLLEDDSALLTATGFGLMTPDYASPEQVRGEPISVASDVYSLGVILFQLLAGERPYRLSQYTPSEVIRLVCEEGIPAPSEAARIPRLRRELRGDLDNILLKALRKEPERRYPSVEQFARDIRRYLDGQTVLARPDTFSYRMSKLVRRHRVAFALGVALVLSVAVGTALTVREGLRARNRFAQVQTFARRVMTDFDGEARRLPGSTKLRQMMVDQSLRYVDSLAAEAGDDAVLLRDLAGAYHRIADIQGYPRIPNLGQPEAALSNHEKALRIEEDLRKKHGLDTALAASMATGYAHVAELRFRRIDDGAAEVALARALELAQPSDPETWLAVRLNWTRLLFRRGDLEQAAQVAEDALALAERQEDPAMAMIFGVEGCYRRRYLGQPAEAVALADRGLRAAEAGRAKYGDDARFVRREVGLMDAKALALGDSDDASLGRYCEAFELARKAFDRLWTPARLEVKEAAKQAMPVIAGLALNGAKYAAWCGRPESMAAARRNIETLDPGSRRMDAVREAEAVLAWKQGHGADALRTLRGIGKPSALEAAARIEREAGRTREAVELLKRARELRAPTLNVKGMEQRLAQLAQARNLALTAEIDKK